MAKVLFVCLGNICRSPTAQGVFEKMLADRGLSDKVLVDSCGTGGWHVGSPPDERTVKTAKEYGYDLSHLRARKFAAEDFGKFDYILAMDARNLADVIKHVPRDYQGTIKLFLDYAKDVEVTEVPDPYYGGSEGFTRVIKLIENACQGLIDEIESQA